MHRQVVEASTRQTDIALSKVIEAKDSEVRGILAAKDKQIAALTAECIRAEKLAERERSRSEAAIDALLALKAGASPIRTADLQRIAAEINLAAEAGTDGKKPAHEDKKLAELARVFNEMGSVAEDDGHEPPPPANRVQEVGGGVMMGEAGR